MKENLDLDLELEEPSLTVNRIQKRQGFYFFYVGVKRPYKYTDKPYELIKIISKNNPALQRIAVLEPIKDIEGVEISQSFAHNLGLELGDEVKLKKLDAIISSVDTISLAKIKSEAPIIDEGEKENESDSDQNLQEYIQELSRIGLVNLENGKSKNLKEPTIQELKSHVKKMFSYSYMTVGHEFCYKGDWYKITSAGSNKNIKHFLLLPGTKINLENSNQILSSEDIIGLEEPYQSLKEMITWPNLYQQDYKRLNIEPPKGILLSGPSGTGKTHLMRQIAKNTNLNFISIKGPEIISKYVGGSEKELRKIFESAKKNQPSLIFFDEIDAIGSKRNPASETDSKLVTQLLTLMDGLESRGNVIIVAATNQPNLLDPALRRPGRLDTEIMIKLPNLENRKKLLELFLKNTPKDDTVDLNSLAQNIPGFAHADIKYLVNQAKINVIKRLQERPKETRNITNQDLISSLNCLDPSILREFNILKSTKKSLSEIIGYKDVKEKIFRQIYLYTRYPNLFKKSKTRKIKGILLQGPPGTGKTSLAKALATDLNYNFLSISAAEINSKFVGESEQKIKELFKKARMTAPTIVFMDELDSLFSTSSQISNTSTHEVTKTGQFLTEMDGALSTEDDIIIIGTTNKTKYLDPALLRPGRFDLVLTMGYPDKEELRQLFKFYFGTLIKKGTKLDSILDYSLKNKLVGADIEAIKKIAIFGYIKDKSPTQMKSLEEKCKEEGELDITFLVEDLKKATEEFVNNKNYKPKEIDVRN